MSLIYKTIIKSKKIIQAPVNDERNIIMRIKIILNNNVAEDKIALEIQNNFR